uniref:Cytochrome C biogenesis protein transmembrane domain-containing protein n=1 Tax=Bellilinea caldifistulae TaxID=360411 RepID=A0A7C4L2R6_9CHLR
MENIFTTITIGLLATTSPCVFPLYPGYLAYLSNGNEHLQKSKGRYLLGFLVLAGVLTMMLAIGLVIALLAVPIGSALSIVVPLADILIFLLGVLLLFNINPFRSLPVIRVPLLQNPYFNAFVYGLLYGPIALPCAGPLVVSVFALSLTAGELLSRLGTFMGFGLGFGIPLLLLSFLAGSQQRWITLQFARHGKWVNRIGGVILITIAVVDFFINWELIRSVWFG